MSITRRDFIGTTALAAGALATAAPAMPTRELGKTGARVSILAFGSGSKFLAYKDEDKALTALGKALDMGITYIDTSDDYGKEHQSEQWIGKGVKGRKGIFVATKLSNRDGSQARKIVEESLKALQMDRIDLIHIHSVRSAEDLAKIEEKGGVLEQLRKFRDEKIVRFLGITGHADPASMQTALERHDFDCCQMALNAGTVAMMNGAPGKGMVPNPEMKTSFETTALPVAVSKKMGIIAMKTFAQDALIGQATPEKLMYYSLTLPVTAVVIGMPKLEHIDDNIRLAKAYAPLPKDEMKKMSAGLSAKNKVALDRFYRDHIDA